MRKTAPYVEPTATCSIERSVEVLGERWTFLILRQAHVGTTRFADFRDELGIAPDVLAARLEKLVSAGILSRQEYQAPGERTRLDYQLTQAGVDLRVVLGALQQWGDLHLPKPDGPTMMRRDIRTDKGVGVAFIDDEGNALATEDVYLVNPDAAPGV